MQSSRTPPKNKTSLGGAPMAPLWDPQHARGVWIAGPELPPAPGSPGAPITRRRLCCFQAGLRLRRRRLPGRPRGVRAPRRDEPEVEAEPAPALYSQLAEAPPTRGQTTPPSEGHAPRSRPRPRRLRAGSPHLAPGRGEVWAGGRREEGAAPLRRGFEAPEVIRVGAADGGLLWRRGS